MRRCSEAVSRKELPDLAPERATAAALRCIALQAQQQRCILLHHKESFFNTSDIKKKLSNATPFA
jgi:hypothetical protein